MSDNSSSDEDYDDNELIQFVTQRKLEQQSASNNNNNEPDSLKKQLQQKEGEITILRWNLNQSNQSYSCEIEQLKKSQAENKKKSDLELESLRSEIQRLKNEKDFLVNEVQQTSFQQKLQATAKPATTGAHTTPTTSPKGKSVANKRDFASSFRDGFDNSISLSPSKRKKQKLQLIQKMEEDTTTASASNERPSPQNGNFNDNTRSYHQDDNVILSSLYKNTYVLDFVQLILNHNILLHDQEQPIKTTLEELDRYRDFKTNLPMGVILQRVVNGKSLSPDVVLSFIDTCLELLEQCILHAQYAPVHYLLSLLYETLSFDPKTVLQSKLDAIFHFIKQNLITGLNVILKESDRPLPQLNYESKILLDKINCSWYIITVYLMDILEVVCFCCGLDADLFRKCWTLIDTKFIITLLCPQIPSTLLYKSVLVLISSISKNSIGHIDTRPQGFRTVTNDFVITESELIDYCKRLINNLPLISNVLLVNSFDNDVDCHREQFINPYKLEYVDKKTSEYTLGVFKNNDQYLYGLKEINDISFINLQRTLMQFFSFILINHGITPLIEEDNSLIIEVIDCLSDQFEILYMTPHFIQTRLNLINDCVRFLHSVWFLHPESSKILKDLPTDKSHGIIVSLARVGFGDMEEEAYYDVDDNNNEEDHSKFITFPEDVIEKARDILEQSSTAQEAEDIYEVMSNDFEIIVNNDDDNVDNNNNPSEV